MPSSSDHSPTVQNVMMGFIPWSSHLLGILPLLIGGILFALATFRFATDQFSKDRTATVFVLCLAVALQCTSLVGFVIVSSARKRPTSLYSSIIVVLFLAAAGLGCCLLLRDSYTEGYRFYFTELLQGIREQDRVAVKELVRYQEWQKCCGMWNHSDWTERPDPFGDGLSSCDRVAEELQVPPRAVIGCYPQIASRQRVIAGCLVTVGIVGAVVQLLMTKRARKYMLW